MARVHERWGVHSLTQGWSQRSASRPRLVAERPPWWPGASSLPAPTIFEMVGPASCGKLSLAQLWLAAADRGGLVAVIDERHDYYPPSAVACGLDLARLVVVRPPGAKAAVEAAGLLLGSGGFDAVLWPLGESTRVYANQAARLASVANKAGSTLVALVNDRRRRAPDHEVGMLPADLRLRVVEWEWLVEDGLLGGVRARLRTTHARGRAPDREWELTLSAMGQDDGPTAGHLRLAAAFPVGGGVARAAGAERLADRDLRPERAVERAG